MDELSLVKQESFRLSSFPTPLHTCVEPNLWMKYGRTERHLNQFGLAVLGRCGLQQYATLERRRSSHVRNYCNVFAISKGVHNWPNVEWSDLPYMKLDDVSKNWSSPFSLRFTRKEILWANHFSGNSNSFLSYVFFLIISKVTFEISHLQV